MVGFQIWGEKIGSFMLLCYQKNDAHTKKASNVAGNILRSRSEAVRRISNTMLTSSGELQQ